MARVQFGRGDASAVVDEDLAGFVREGLRRATRGVSDILEESAEDIYQRAFAAWPRDSGESAEGLERGLRVRTDVVEAFIAGSTDYDFYIRKDGVHIWTELIRRPVENRADEIIDDLEDSVLQALGA